MALGRFLHVLAVSTLLLAPTVAAQEGGLNEISAIRVRQDGPISIEVVGTRKPSFTSFTMSGPHRLFIDFADAVFRGVPPALALEGGLVESVRTSMHGSDQASIARVVLRFRQEVETEFRTEGGTLVIRATATGPLVAVAELPRKDAPSEANGAADEKRQQEAAKADAERKGREEEAARLAAEEQRRVEAEAARRKTEEELRAREEAARLAAAEEKQRQQEALRLKAEEEKRAREEAARLAAEEKKRQEEEARLKLAEEKRAREEAARLAAEEKKRQQEEARLAAEQEKKAREEAARLAAEEKRRQQEEARLAAEQERKAREEAAARTARAEPRGSGEITGSVETVGFRLLGNTSRVFVRTTGEVVYSIREAGPDTVVLTLERTAIGKRNNARRLDTSFFESTVQLVDPQPGNGEVSVAIKVKRHVPYQVRQNGNEIHVDFEEP